ncbi:hypothetical protein cyc_00778 [Cyclospora cayetanensis]|uniref:Uncharacterized protein n=1 Tax=Cyclospora cayetanensis TaxID=88456 RepID=A0A1D3CV38_9EIME|nr:hypothetical protein cyc_00778 [Cyclospora cayetanensis]
MQHIHLGPRWVRPHRRIPTNFPHVPLFCAADSTATSSTSNGNLTQSSDACGVDPNEVPDRITKDTRLSTDMHLALHTALHDLTSSELSKLLEHAGFSLPQEAADREALARSLRALLDRELTALEEADDQHSSLNPAKSHNHHKEKLRMRLESLRKDIDAETTTHDCVDSPSNKVQPQSRPFSQISSLRPLWLEQPRQFSWDSELYSLRELVGGLTEGGEGNYPPSEESLLRVRDEQVREIIFLPAQLMEEEVEAAARLLTRSTAPSAPQSSGVSPVLPQETQGPVFEGRCSASTIGAPRTLLRLQYELSQVIKDLNSTFCLLQSGVQCRPRGPPGESGPGVQQRGAEGLADPQEAPESSEMMTPERQIEALKQPLLSLLGLMPEFKDRNELLGAAYCTKVKREAGDSAENEKLRGILLLPGNLSPRDARVRYLADRIAHSCQALVLVPELLPSGSNPPSLADSASSPSLNRLAEGQLAAMRLRPYGLQGLIARALLWMHLSEGAQTLGLVGVGEGAKEALLFAALAAPGAHASVALPAAASAVEKNCRLNEGPSSASMAQDRRLLPHLDTVVALYPTEFNIDQVAAKLQLPTLALFDEEPIPADKRLEPKNKTEGNPHGIAEVVPSSFAAAFDKALRKIGRTKDHWVQAVPRSAKSRWGKFSELVDDDLLLMTTSWLSLWMGGEVPHSIDAVRDVSGFELRFRDFRHTDSSVSPKGEQTSGGASTT